MATDNSCDVFGLFVSCCSFGIGHARDPRTLCASVVLFVLFLFVPSSGVFGCVSFLVRPFVSLFPGVFLRFSFDGCGTALLKRIYLIGLARYLHLI